MDPEDIANNFNIYFVSVADNLMNSYDNQLLDFKYYLQEREIQSFMIAPVIEEELIDVVRTFNDSSPGNDEIPMKLIKEVAVIIVPVLLHICNSSFQSGIFPEDLKVAKITPIYKVGDKREFKNHRPISVLSSFGKIVEKLMYNRM